MKSYSAFFVRADSIEELEVRAGGGQRNKLYLGITSAVKVEGSQWIIFSYHPGDGPPDDEVLWGKASLAEKRSETLGEIIFLYADTSGDDFFVYEHARDGVMLRKLVWFPMLDDDWTPGWLYVQGEPEQWEAEVFFRPNRLSEVIENERINYEERGEDDRFPEREAAIRCLWEKRSIAAGDTIPSCDGTVALVVEKHFGLRRP